MSHLLQMRGLKHSFNPVVKIQQQSHLLQMRGLKHKFTIFILFVNVVASFTDAWIETFD